MKFQWPPSSPPCRLNKAYVFGRCLGKKSQSSAVVQYLAMLLLLLKIGLVSALVNPREFLWFQTQALHIISSPPKPSVDPMERVVKSSVRHVYSVEKHCSWGTYYDNAVFLVNIFSDKQRAIKDGFCSFLNFLFIYKLSSHGSTVSLLQSSVHSIKALNQTLNWLTVNTVCFVVALLLNGGAKANLSPALVCYFTC